MEIKAYQPQFLKLFNQYNSLKKIHAIQKHRWKTWSLLKQMKIDIQHWLWKNNSVLHFSLYMKGMDQHHILLIQKRFSLDHLLLMHDTGVKV